MMAESLGTGDRLKPWNVCCSRLEPLIRVTVAEVRIKYPCGRAPGEASVAPVILAAFYLGHTFSFIRKRKILILAHLESL